MKDIPYQEIFNILQEILPNNWHRAAFYAEYGESSYSMKYFVDLGSGQYIDCFNLKDIPKRDIIKAFSVIDSQIMPIRKELSKKDAWSVMTLVIDDEGNFKADFEYDDISENFIEYYQRWKKKYLND